MTEQHTPAPVGSLAPEFSLPHTATQTLALRSLQGQHIVVVFYPLDWEPVSREQLALYQDYLVEFESLGASLLGISVDHVWSHDAFARDTRIRYPLLSDARPRGSISRLYGVYREDKEWSARALFVIDAERVIRFCRVYPDEINPGVHDILTSLETMRREERRRPGTF